MRSETVQQPNFSSTLKKFYIRIIDRFPRDYAWRLFLVSSLPLNFWAMIVWFKNVGPVSVEYGSWDTLGLGAYMLTYALIEIVAVYTVFLLAFTLLPRPLLLPRTFTFFSANYFLVTFVFILLQSRAVVELPRIGKMWPYLRAITRFYSSYHLIILGILAITILSGLAGILLSKKMSAIVDAVMERLYLLSGIYLAFNFLALIIVVVRNF